MEVTSDHFNIFIVVLVTLCGEGAPQSGPEIADIRRKSPIHHYYEMKCSASPSWKNLQAFVCAFEKLKFPTKKCVYKGKLLNPGEEIPNNECTVGCVCSDENVHGSSSFLCAVVDCLPPNDKCVRQYNLGDCCSSKEICDPKAISKLARCRIDGDVYYEGEVFYPKDNCKKCVCRKGFKDNLILPHCKPIECGLETYSGHFIISRCAPIYYSKGSQCCPIGWECFNNNTILMAPKTSKFKCQFGSLRLNIGDRVVASNKCLECSCDYPPLVTCLLNATCIP